MQLLELPTETLLQILECVGSPFFHKDVRRLAVCRQWFAAAHAVFFRDIRISQRVLRRLVPLAASSAKPPPAAAAALRAQRLLQLRAEVLCLELTGMRPEVDWEPPSANYDGSDLSRFVQHRLAAWTTALQADLVQLAAAVLSGAHRLRELHVRAAAEARPPPPYISAARGFVRHRDYLSWTGIRALLQALPADTHLTVLDLDLWGSLVRASPPDQFAYYHEEPRGSFSQDDHLCAAISHLLATAHALQCLRLRLRSICPRALQLGGGGGGSDSSGDASNNAPPLHNLCEVIVNLSFPPEQGTFRPIICSQRCGTWFRPIPAADMEAAAAALATQMASPKTVRVLWRDGPDEALLSLDVLTGRRMVLAEGAAWDADGIVYNSLAGEDE